MIAAEIYFLDISQLLGPNISLPNEKLEQLKKEIQNFQTNVTKESTSQSNQADFSRYKQMNFIELVKAEDETVGFHQSSDLDKRLYDEFEETSKTEKYKKMFEFRHNLPSFKHRDEIVESLKRNQVLLIAGSTGCGKTTQVAQYILDNALMNMEGSKTKVICTQPRRIAGTQILDSFGCNF